MDLNRLPEKAVDCVETNRNLLQEIFKDFEVIKDKEMKGLPREEIEKVRDIVVNIIHKFDHLSEEICLVTDLSNLLTYIHPNPGIKDAAVQADLIGNSFFCELNTYDQVHQVFTWISKADATLNNNLLSSEERRFVDLSISEFIAMDLDPLTVNQCRKVDSNIRRISRLLEEERTAPK